jgi:hypothetical protein
MATTVRPMIASLTASDRADDVAHRQPWAFCRAASMPMASSGRLVPTRRGRADRRSGQRL